VSLASLIIGVIAIIAAVLVGYCQWKTTQKSLVVTVKKAIPKVGTRVRIDERQKNPSGFPAFYYLILTIYNDGELPAKQLKGHCKLHSSTKSVQERDIPFQLDSLGPSSPYELEALWLLDGLSGAAIDLKGNGAENIGFNVDIEFECFGIPENVPQRYSAQYKYDPQSRQIVRIQSHA